LQTYPNDLIQFFVHIKYYIIYKWLLNWNIKKKIKLKVRNKLPKSLNFTLEDKSRKTKLSNWILTNKYLMTDTSKFLEIDYLTLSILILYDPFLFTDFNIYSFFDNKYNIINLYNWKYIT
jgi:hypothetical protein